MVSKTIIVVTTFCQFLVIVNAFLADEGGFDPNAINGFPSGPFNPNAGISTIPTPAISGGGSGGSGFNPNAGQATTIPPPTFNGFTGWAGSGNFNPTTSNPFGGGFGGDGGWGFGDGSGGSAPKARSGPTTRSPFSNFGNNNWGFGTGSGGFNPNAPFTTTTVPTIHPTTITIHPTTPTPSNGDSQSTIASSMTTSNRNMPMMSKLASRMVGAVSLSTLITPTPTAGTLKPTDKDSRGANIAIIG